MKRAAIAEEKLPANGRAGIPEVWILNLRVQSSP